MITSSKNRKVARAVRLKKRTFRERDARFLVEGAQAVGEALATGHPEILFATDPTHPLMERARSAGVEALHVSEDLMGRLSSTVTPQGLVGVMPFVDVPPTALPAGAGSIVVLHSVRDPGNAGTIVRSAHAAGAGAVVFSSGSVDVYNPKTVRATAGSLFHVPVVREAETSEVVRSLRSQGRSVLAMDPDGVEDLYDVDLARPTAFLFGNEAWGLPREVAGLADTTVRVPIAARAESLNLAAAATVCLFEWARQGRAGPGMPLASLVVGAAHDIRSPLTAVKGFGYALERRWEAMREEQRAAMLEGILLDADRMDTIVKQLVDAARLAVGTLELFPERVDLGRLVEDIGRAASRDPEHPEVVWEGETADALVDPDRLRTTLAAFLEAAVWWAREGPIIVRGGRRDLRLWVEVTRAGAEIAPGDLQTLFEARRPGSGSRSKIGLFVARGVAEAQGGSVSASVEEGRLRLVLEIPVPESAG